MKRKILGLLLTMVMLVTMLPTAAVAVDTNRGSIYLLPPESRDSERISLQSDNDLNEQSSVIEVAHDRTIDEIVETIRTYENDGLADSKQPSFDVSPKYVAPYEAGELSDSDLQDALNALKVLRYLAGVPYTDIVLDENEITTAQHKAVLMAVSEYSHYPDKPADMSDEFYNTAQDFSAECIAGASWMASLASRVVSWVTDTGANNIDQAGHRMILLDPNSTKVGFGYANNPSAEWSNLYAAHVVDTRDGDVDSYVAWPNSGNFPIQYFVGEEYEENLIQPWSLSLGKEYKYPKRDNISLVLTRKRDNKVWIFDEDTPQQGEDNYSPVLMHLSVSGNDILFRPDVNSLGEIEDGDIFNVKLTGIQYTDGTAAELSYDINFFDLEEALSKSTVTINVKHNGTAVSGATVSIDGKTLTTDDDGNASTRVKNNDSYAYTVNKNGYAAATGNITVGENAVTENVALTMPVTFTITNTEKTYNGATQGVSVSANPNVTYKVTYNGSSDIPKNAGTYNVAVESDADGYSGTAATTLTISKAPISIKADDKSKKEGGNDPVLTYSIVSGQLYGSDVFTGSLERKSGETLGSYAITQGTLTAGDNYVVSFTPGTFSIVDKTPQNITISQLSEKTYGDEPFKITVTPDSESGLDEFTYESDKTDVAEIAADGTVTIKGAGEANITIKQAGNDEYAEYSNTQKLVVNQKSVKITAIDLDTQTATFDGILGKDSDVSLDFSALKISDVTPDDESNSSVTVTSFVLKGDNSANYKVATESISAKIKNENLVTVSITASNGTVTGAGQYIKGSSVTVTVTANSGYRFTGWSENGSSISKETSYTFTADEDTALTANFSRKSSGGGGGGGSSSSSYTVKFETNGGSTVANKTVSKNSKLTMPDDPTKDGYTFDGWYTDKALTKAYDSSKNVTSSMTLYAKWTEEDPQIHQIILTIGKKNARVFGKTKSNDVAPKIVNERTMLPARFVAENLGADVEWIGEEQKVRITKDDTEILIFIGSDRAKVNGKEVTLDSPAFIEDERTYTPIRFISEELGASVDWNEETQEVTITQK